MKRVIRHILTTFSVVMLLSPIANAGRKSSKFKNPKVSCPVRVTNIVPEIVNGANYLDCAGDSAIDPEPHLASANSQGETHLTVNPKNPDNMVVTSHQGRISAGGTLTTFIGTTFDGGETWKRIYLPWSECTGSTISDPATIARVSDPWVEFNCDGSIVHGISLVEFTSVEPRPKGLLYSRSVDGGNTWTPPRLIVVADNIDPEAGILADGSFVSVDPTDPLSAYIALTDGDRPDGQISLQCLCTADGGLTWDKGGFIEQAAVDPEAAADFFFGGFFSVDPRTNELVVIYNRNKIIFEGSFVTVSYFISRSSDGGQTWTTPEAIPNGQFSVSFDGVAAWRRVRGFGVANSIAFNPHTRRIYITLIPDNELDPAIPASTVIVSRDFGRTWSKKRLLKPLATDTITKDLGVTIYKDRPAFMFYDARDDENGRDPEKYKTLTPIVQIWNKDVTKKCSDDIRLMSKPDANFNAEDLPSSVPGAGVSGSAFFMGEYQGITQAGDDLALAYLTVNPIGIESPALPEEGIVVDPINRGDVYFQRINFCDKKKR